MNRFDLEYLGSLRGYPALSILMPTHRSAPNGRRDAIRLKNLVTQATEVLLSQFSRHEIDPLLKRLQALLVEIDYRKTLDGLALFVNRDTSRYFYLPFAPRKRFVVDESFAVGELLARLNSRPRYWVLVLGRRPTRLFEGWQEQLVSVNRDGFPMSDRKPSEIKPLPVGYGIERSKHRAERDRAFLRRVDAALGTVASHENLPLIVIGTERWLAYFEQVSRHRSMVVWTLAGNHFRTPAHELARLVGPVIHAHLAQQRRAAMGEMEKALSAGRLASGLEQVREKAQETYGATLMLEEEMVFPPYREPGQGLPDSATSSTGADQANDAVEELIVAVLARNGRAIFVEKGAIETQGGIAMVLPY